MINQKHCFSRIFISLIAVLAMGVSLLSRPAWAQQPKNEITMSPASSTIELKAGQSFDGSFKIYNTGDVDFDFTVSASPYSVKGEDYEQDFETKSEQTYLSDWVKFEQDEYFVKTKEHVVVNYHIAVPKEIPAGGQYAVLFAETAGGTSGSIMSTKRVGTLLYARTDGKNIDEGTAEAPKIPKIKFNSNLLVKQIIANSGNTDFESETTIKATTLFGREVFSDTRSNVRILPKSRRAVEMTWDNAPLLGILNINLTTKFLGETFEYSGWTFFISPIIIGAVVLVVVALILWKYYGRQKKHF